MRSKGQTQGQVEKSLNRKEARWFGVICIEIDRKKVAFWRVSSQRKQQKIKRQTETTVVITKTLVDQNYESEATLLMEEGGRGC
jgi:hypothetical protein